MLLLFVAYQFSFSKTFELRKQYNSLKNEQKLFDNISQKLISLQQQNIYYDSILKSKKISTESSFQNNLLQTITTFTDSTKLKIVAFNSPHMHQTESAIINTFSFSLNGSFSKNTNLIYLLEQQQKIGKIVSVNFEKKKNYRRNTNFLECTIYLQQIEEK